MMYRIVEALEFHSPSTELVIAGALPIVEEPFESAVICIEIKVTSVDIRTKLPGRPDDTPAFDFGDTTFLGYVIFAQPFTLCFRKRLACICDDTCLSMLRLE